MHGGDSEEEEKRLEEERVVELKPKVVELKPKVVELKPEVVEFNTLHKREEELHFLDTFAYPWEKDRHYKRVYQLEKKYFPDQGLDKAFLEPGETNSVTNSVRNSKSRKKIEQYNNGMVFFEEEEKEREVAAAAAAANEMVKEKKVEEFFKV